jgi:TM2 domain-containing membrane protein YozV
MFCSNCGKQNPDNARFCANCGATITDQPNPQYTTPPPQPQPQYSPPPQAAVQPPSQHTTPPPPPQYVAVGGKSKLAAGLLGIFLGAWGIHRFYLGYVGIGIAQIIVTIVTFGFGALWGFIEGILILTGTFNKDAKGFGLKGD